MRPGSTTWPDTSTVSRAENLEAIASGVSMPTMSRPSIARAPGDSTRPARSIVTTVPPLTISDTARRSACGSRMEPAAIAHAHTRKSMSGNSISQFPLRAPLPARCLLFLFHARAAYHCACPLVPSTRSSSPSRSPRSDLAILAPASCLLSCLLLASCIVNPCLCTSYRILSSMTRSRRCGIRYAARALSPDGGPDQPAAGG